MSKRKDRYMNHKCDLYAKWIRKEEMLAKAVMLAEKEAELKNGGVIIYPNNPN